MTIFFNRMQTATRAYSDSTPAYLRTHPMTTERIADIQARIRSMHYHQRPDSVDYHLIRARVRLLQDNSTQGLVEAERYFKEQLTIKTPMQTMSAHYGLAIIALQRNNPALARHYLDLARNDAKDRQGIPETRFLRARRSTSTWLPVNSGKPSRKPIMPVSTLPCRAALPTSIPMHCSSTNARMTPSTTCGIRCSNTVRMPNCSDNWPRPIPLRASAP